MSRFVASLIALVLAAVIAPIAPAAASTAEEFLNAPVWYIEYQVTLTSEYSGSYETEGGKVSFTSKLERVMSDRKEFNLRSQGLGPIGMAAFSGSAGGQPSVADAQKMTTQMLAGIDNQANWLAAGSGVNENATEADIAADTTPSSPCRIDYTRVETGKGFMDEVGNKFDFTTTTTIRGADKVLIMAMGSLILEMDTAAKTYALVLPIGPGPTGEGVTKETVTVTTPAGGGSPSTERQSDAVTYSYPERIILDTPQLDGAQGGALIRGQLDPASGKISGEQSFKAHYSDGAQDAPATVVFKYTLTMTPPKKK